MRLALDFESLEPVYVQISGHFRNSILTENLRPGIRLPAVRTLAANLGVSRGTVESAYAELMAEGLITSRQGSGFYVLPHAPGEARNPPQSGGWPAWQGRLSYGGCEAMSAYLPEVSRKTDWIALDGGACDPRLFPMDEFRKLLGQVMRRDGVAAVEYGEIAGYRPLRATLAQVLASQGIQTDAESILITAGSQQALSLVTGLILSPGDAVVVEGPTYAGALDVFRARGLRILTVGVDEEGMDMRELEAVLSSHRPGLIYTIPNFHNPTGACLDGQRRRQLISLAGRFDVPILEDDYVGDIRYEGRAQPTLKSLDPDGRVIYMSTFSKMLIPGLRVGFVVADGPVYAHLLRAKRCHDLATCNLIQRALKDYVSVGRYHAHLQRSCTLYRRRRDAMLAALARHMPEGTSWTRPKGGLFVWLRLPEGMKASDLLPKACGEGVIFAPGGNFFLDPAEGEGGMRLNFASNTEAVIEEGVRRLGVAMGGDNSNHG
ncbi:GntR family transcriptional regulator / MocR family aminotransferase [Desulfomicrobium norvegicum]|uniref:GntR family transcriptional regulator / MocR family aminotransferase n=1 Tax=Desulfomicrobium norvegicum (strain DSM 1741 / NCIMB 8310) TaxID=52561 RepID=A0A8G2C374_DESNO|nr:PLP-dependent aminotransferase family protein [Desulfomicrobium norvegicum]SFL77858.1 GntR family transcriptional regulator / MocR family aminotransferase [Desulfomicrobium norvegicum]